MKYAGLTVFILFFGLSVLDALRNGHWLRAALWLLLGFGFYLMDSWRQARRATRRSAP